MAHIRRGAGAAVLAISLAASAVACSDGGPGGGTGPGAGPGAVGSGEITSGSVDSPVSHVSREVDGSGVETSGLLLDSAPVAVVAAPGEGDVSRAASAAVGLRAPMFTAVDGGAAALEEELDRLGVERVLTVGAVTVDDADREVVPAPVERDALEDLTGVTFAATTPVPADRVDDHLVHQLPGSPVLLEVRGSDSPGAPVGTGAGGDSAGGDSAGGDVEAFEPGEPAWSADDAPRVLVHDRTPVAPIATAVATGAAVSHLRAPDPRVDGGAVDAVRDAGTVIALGPGWGDDDLGEHLHQARTVPELPGGGQLHFPGRRYVAAYGSPVTPSLGILGEQGPEESVARVEVLAERYRSHSPEPVVPAFEIIGTVASGGPGEDGDFTNVWGPERLAPLVDAITAAGGYAVIDLQPGKADFLDQARIYEDLLRRPGVGLALDPEWKLGPGQQPGAQIGSVDAEEINRVSDWLADLTAESGGPQKLLILHQFSAQMITNRDRIDTSRPEVAMVLHADGHGTPGVKLGTWDRLREGLPPGIRMAWKNFYDEDTPTFTPGQTMDVHPRPWFVSYQ